MKMESCIKIGKPIQTLFDKDKKNSDKFLCRKICEAKLSFLISILFFFFDRKNILSSTKALNGSNFVHVRLRYTRFGKPSHHIQRKKVNMKNVL